MTQDSSNAGMMPWPTIQVMAFLLGRSLEVHDDNNPDVSPKLLSPTPIYDFLTRGVFHQPQTDVIHERIMKASYRHIANLFEPLRYFKKREARELLIPVTHQLVHDITIHLKSAKNEDGIDKSTLISNARSAKSLEECRAIAELAGPEAFQAFDKSCDRIEYNWIKKMAAESGLSEYINLPPLPYEKLDEIANRPMKGFAVYGSMYDIPAKVRASLTGDGGIALKGFPNDGQPRHVDPFKRYVRRFMGEKGIPKGWTKN